MQSQEVNNSTGTQTFDLAISPCPNDTFIFGHMIRDGVDGASVETHFADVEELNRRALEEGRHAVTKLSFFAMSRLRDRYELLHCGGALGRGCGPLLISGKNFEGNEGAALDALRSGGRVLTPGRWTTANLLTHLYLADRGLDVNAVDFVPVRYEQIMPALTKGEADFGVIIHEERFTFQRHGLFRTADLGEWWESTTGLPIPLGCIAVRKDRAELRAGIEDAIRASIAKAYAQPESLNAFIKEHSQALEEDVIRAHIDLYVNDFSKDMGATGRAAVDELFTRADAAGIA